MGSQEALPAVGIYAAYPKMYSAREDNAWILYRLAGAEGKTEKLVAALNRIGAEHPSSQYIGEARFRRSEYLFIAREHASTEQAYGAVVLFCKAGSSDTLSYDPAGWFTAVG
jgi:hypothetical protein